MNRTQKKAFVSNLTQGINEADAFAVMSFAKLSVEKMTSFRLALAKKNVKVRVLKNTLARRAFGETNFKRTMDGLTGNLMLAYGTGDAVEATKAIYEWVGKEDFELEVKMGAALGDPMSSAQLKALSVLPGREELLVKFLWGLKSPMQKFLYALTDKPNKLGYALGALKEKKEKEANA